MFILPYFIYGICAIVGLFGFCTIPALREAQKEVRYEPEPEPESLASKVGLVALIVLYTIAFFALNK